MQLNTINRSNIILVTNFVTKLHQINDGLQDKILFSVFDTANNLLLSDSSVNPY